MTVEEGAASCSQRIWRMTNVTQPGPMIAENSYVCSPDLTHAVSLAMMKYPSHCLDCQQWQPRTNFRSTSLPNLFPAPSHNHLINVYFNSRCSLLAQNPNVSQLVLLFVDTAFSRHSRRSRMLLAKLNFKAVGISG